MTDNSNSRITSFTQLRTWQLAREYVSLIYTSTKHFPKDELFGLTSQIRRSAVSVPANIAEGFSRAGVKEKAQFYQISLGSLTETLSHLYIAQDLGYISEQELQEFTNKTENIHKMLNGLIKSAKGRTP